MSALNPASPVIRFLPYQKAWIADQSRFKIGMFSRQTGKTFSTGGECADDCFTAWAEDRRARWVILSRGERQAAEMMTEVIKPFTKAYYEVYNTLLKGGEPTFHEGEFRAPQERGADAVYKQLEVAFPNGSRITALPANPDTARGFSANVILDEFAFHAKSREIWAALFPVISRSGLKLRVISTPNGKGNKFFELMTAEDTVWSRHVVDIYEAVRQGLDRDIDMLSQDVASTEHRTRYEDALTTLGRIADGRAALVLPVQPPAEGETPPAPEVTGPQPIVMGGPPRLFSRDQMRDL